MLIPDSAMIEEICPSIFGTLRLITVKRYGEWNAISTVGKFTERLIVPNSKNFFNVRAAILAQLISASSVDAPKWR